jgi:C-terminal processing protease CtpA/Prc
VVVDPDFAGIRSRLSFVPVGLDVGDVTLAPDAKTAVFLATTAGQVNLHAYAVGEPPAGSAPVARQLTTTSGVKSDLRIAPDGRDVYYLDAGRIHVVSIDRREARALPVAAELDQDFAADKYTVFAQVWTLIRDHFFDPRFNGVDWDEARHRYRPFVQGAATPDELRRVVSLMLGELNASHLGLSAPASSATSPAAGRLGLEFDRLAAETDGRFAVTSVIPLGPADLTSAIRPGDAIEAVDGAPLGRASNLDALLAHTTGKRVTLTVRSAAGPPRAVALRPVSQAAEKQLLYRAWVDRNREYVLKASGGRLGYVHMINMSAEALDQLLVDLDADNHKLDGVVVDVRNNTGGFVNGFALDVFARQSYLRMATRAVPEAPARSILGQRALELPTILVVNQHSLSDAEDFVEGYRTLKLGSIVGEPTAGWIVYTWDRRLVDGSLLRLPRMRVKGADGQDMEMRPRPVQVAVSRPLGEWQEGRDRQLDEAIRVLLKQLGRAE